MWQLYLKGGTALQQADSELSLYTHGPGGLSELKSKLSGEDLNQVYVAFLRQDAYKPESEFGYRAATAPGYIMINYIPQSVSGVRKGR